MSETREERGPGELSPQYRMMADKIGGLPNLRMKDNLIQAGAIGVGTAAATLGGFIGWGPAGALEGFLVGLVGSLILSGAVLGIYRLVRS